MRIVDRSVYVGPSLYARFPVIRLELDLGPLEAWPTGRLGQQEAGGQRGQQAATEHTGQSSAQHFSSPKAPRETREGTAGDGALSYPPIIPSYPLDIGERL